MFARNWTLFPKGGNRQMHSGTKCYKSIDARLDTLQRILVTWKSESACRGILPPLQATTDWWHFNTIDNSSVWVWIITSYILEQIADWCMSSNCDKFIVMELANGRSWWMCGTRRKWCWWSLWMLFVLFEFAWKREVSAIINPAKIGMILRLHVLPESNQMVRGMFQDRFISILNATASIPTHEIPGFV